MARQPTAVPPAELRHPAWSGGTPSMPTLPAMPAVPAWPLGRSGLGSERPTLLIMDVCGAYMRPMGGWFAVSRLVALLEELHVDAQATRSAVSRMRRRDLLESSVRAGVRGYALTAHAIPLLEESDRRIFTGIAPAHLSDGWVFCSFTIPEEQRDKRHLLRARLQWLNFGMVSNGLWMAPRRQLPELRRVVAEQGFEPFVTLVEGHHRGFEDLHDLVRRCWDLKELGDLYAEFITEFGPVAQRWRDEPAHGDADLRDCFVDYTLALHHWRKFPYLDPALPLSLLPDDWAGGAAAELFFELRSRLEAPALQYVRTVGATR